MNTITQHERGLKHISFLRKIFLKKLTGKLSLRFAKGDVGLLQFDQGSFSDDKETFSPTLHRFLTEHIPEFTWQATEPQQQTYGWVAPWIALSEALRKLPSKNNQLHKYHRAFSSLPPMVLKNFPIHRMNFADSQSYMILYHLSLGAPSFNLNIFFLGNLNEESFAQHVRTVLLLFLLGYLRSAPKEESTNKNISIVSRILKRFKAKGAV